MTKRAICIGTNYAGTGYQLAGCLQDAADWSAELDRRGYRVLQLLGADATRDAIIAALASAVADLGYHDRLVVTYSGHGTWIPDTDGDEADGRDEAICPDDFARAGVLTDDDLYRAFSPAGVGEQIVMVSDSCHSGSLNRLAGPVEAEPPPLPEIITSAPVERVSWVTASRRVKFVPPAEHVPDLDAARAVEHLPARGLMRRGALVLSACAATQVTYDAVVDGRPCGIFTHVALKALRSVDAVPERTPSYREWHRAIRAMLPSVDYPDVSPQLDGTATQRRWDALA